MIGLIGFSSCFELENDVLGSGFLSLIFRLVALILLLVMEIVRVYLIVVVEFGSI